MKKLNRHVFNQKCESSLKFEALNVRQSYEKIANASIRSVIRGLLKLFIHIVPAVYWQSSVRFQVFVINLNVEDDSKYFYNVTSFF